MQLDVLQLFIGSKRELETATGKLKALLGPKGILWITYPEGKSWVRAGMNRDIIREHAQTVELHTVALVSVDET